jgi:methionyl-tRNA formyltransferase
MRFVWAGSHTEGIPALHALLDAGAPMALVITLDPVKSGRRAAAEEYRRLCERYGVSLEIVPNLNEAAALRALCSVAPDVVFVIGWPQRVRPETLRLARLGMIGAHGSLLPHNRGAAPINWALIHGDRFTGSTLLWLGETPEQSEIIDQVAFPITSYDTATSLYAKMAGATRTMLLRVLPRLLAGERPQRAGAGTPQQERPLPRRRAADGRIDWKKPGPSVYDFIRALSRPYPGAFSTLEGRRWMLRQAALPPPVLLPAGPPGTIVGPVVSPVPEACGQLVACGTGSIIVLELETESGEVLKGRALSEQPWQGKQWRDD